MKNLRITQAEDEIVLMIDGDTIHVQIDKTLTNNAERLDDHILSAYPITYQNLVALVIETVGDFSSGNKIQAIKIVRRMFSPIGLREAKQIVDNIVESHAKEGLPF